ncbi:hypothetical protein [uncultured Tateyamaria sp.]|uniref:hypothetical protein n=1 Tax=uncultured Tateyamaria sp. TaxID=455651 RepID=UPI002611F8D0|nr:hypothetical protein [uncultured Tateyamaria sp.]
MTRPIFSCWTRRAVPVVMIMALSGCADAPSPATPLFNAFYAKPDRTLDDDAHLSRAIFAFVQGQSQSEATATMQSLGFVCDGATCRYESVDKESGVEKHFGMRMGAETEPKHHRRVLARRFTVTFVADHIATPDDIAGRFEHASGTAPWYRPAAIGDLL